MSDTFSDADKIRNKRLAKLGNPAASQTPSTNQGEDSNVNTTQAEADGTTSKAQEVQEEKKPKINISSAKPPSAAQENPFSKLGLTDGTRVRGESPAQPATASAPKPVKRARPDESSTGASMESSEEWGDKTLSGVFRVSLDESKQADYLGHKLTYLPGLREELEEQKDPIQLNISNLEQAIIEAASSQGRATPLDYLLGCWKRVIRQFRTYKAKAETPKLDIVKEARALCMNYCILAVTEPALFGREPSATSLLAPHLLIDQEDDRGLCHDFLLEITSRFAEDDTAMEAMVGAVEELSRQLALISMDGDFKPYVDTLNRLVRYPALVNAIAASPRFLPEGLPAEAVEKGTLLGPFFQISPLQEDVTQAYFSGASTKDRGAIANAQNALRMSLRTHQGVLLDIINHIIRTSKEARERILDWFALCVNLNHKRRAMRVDRTKVSSDGFMLNVTVCLDQLCEPFMDAQFSKIDRIDVKYLRRKPRVDIQDETKINADQNTSDDFFSKPADGQNTFISEVFFLTVAAHHYGSEAVGTQLSHLEKELKHMEKEIANLEAERPKMTQNPALAARLEIALQRYKDEYEKGVSRKFATQGALLDDLAQGRSMHFMRYVMVWLLRLVSGKEDFPKANLQLPLPDEQKMEFRCLPEYFMEDVVGNFKFVLRHMPHILTSTQSDELVMMCITFLRNGEYVKNPYVKAGLVTIMYAGQVPVYGKSKGVLGDILNSHPFATDYLLHALMKFYNEAEHTGAHTAFYDKFNIRYEIFQIIKCIWANPVYREQLSVEAHVNVEFFVQFVNLLLNDVTYVLDESLSAFVKIHELQQLLASGVEMEQQVRTEKEEALADSQGKAKNYMLLTNESVAMLKMFTEALADSFSMPEIVQRLADMLDYNLDAMVGPKSSQLRVDRPEEYHFQPRVLLAEIVDVYLNLRKKDNFVLAVARDGRSYKPKNLETATQILKKWVLKSPDELREWQLLGDRISEAKRIDDQAEEDLGEIPDEFLDPLMFTLMEDPVVLPVSRTSIDRSTIRSHLLSDPNDPFNRSPLKIEDVLPDTELKARIEAFKTERKEAAQAAAQAAAHATAMDTSDG